MVQSKTQRHITDFISGRKIKATPEEIDAVQLFSKQLVEDYHYPKKHIQTKPQFRVKSKPSDTKKEYPVDIAIFANNKKKEQDIKIIVECKRKNKKDGRSQLEDYLRLSRAYLGVWFNGNERLFLRKIEKHEKVIFEEIPNIPKYGQRLEDIGMFKRKDLKPTHNLRATFKAMRNYLAANTVGVTRDEVLAQQLINIIFCKIYDEKFTKQNDIVSFRAGVNEKPKDIKTRILNIFKKVKDSYHEVLDKTDEIILDENSIAYVVGELQNYCLIEAERDIIADAFETFIGHALKGGQGQFFTPRNVIKMMVHILDPNDKDMVIDPACGSGGFLIETLRYIWKKIDQKGKEYNWPQIEIDREKQKIATEKFRGIDKDYFLSKVTKVYMTLIGDGASGIVCDDSLEDKRNWKSLTNEKIKEGHFDILLTNPPFGSRIPVYGESKLKQFQFGYKWKFDKDNKKWIKTEKLKIKEEPQVLFIEKCLSLLKEGGRMAIVLPNGILGNEKESYLRQHILEQGHLFAIVELPFETFSPHVTINTSVLFIQKGNCHNKNIFISINKYCGHDKKGRPIEKDQLPCVENFYKNNQIDKNNFFIKASLLENNFIAKRYLKKYINHLENIYQSKYPVIDFEEIIDSIHNGANIDDSSIYVEKEEGLPYILVKSITKEGINFENLKYIKKSLEVNKEVIKNKVDEDTILITRAGNSGIATNIPPDLVDGIASGFLIKIKVKEGINPYYLVSFLNSKYGQIQLERISSGSILKSIRSSDVKKIKIILPSKKVQDSIGKPIKEAVYMSTKMRESMISADQALSQLVM